MSHCRSLARTGGRLAVRVSCRSAPSQIRWQSQELATTDATSTNKKHKARRVLVESVAPLKAPRYILSEVREGELGACRIALQSQYSITLRFDGLSEPVPVSTLWLRDTCPCETCVGPSSGQKRFSTHQIPKSLKVESASISEDGSLCVTWQNDIPVGSEASPTHPTHTSTYPREFLLHHLSRGHNSTDLPMRELWNVNAIKERLGYHDYAQYMEDEQAFSKAISDFWRDGLIILNGVPDTERAVQDIAQRIGIIQETIYGRTWDVKSKPEAENIAYTNEYLGPHQDLLYWSDIPAIQILHCLRNDCDGGESLFVDGWLAAVHFAITERTKADALLGLPVNYAYTKGGHNLQRSHTVLQKLENKEPGLRWSPPFQAPFLAPSVSTSFDTTYLKSWRDAASHLAKMIESEDRMLELKLQPGQAVLFDNLRILHGRNQFNATVGERWLKGTYISRSIMLSRIRGVLGTTDESFPNSKLSYQAQAQQLCAAEGIQVLDSVLTRTRATREVKQAHTIQKNKKVAEASSDSTK